ncbi:MAG: 30S ribosomal protein S8 [Candidatus Daviesbacteria bacterium GW2011_GWB1_41_5]|nr:MAG: 30S ribosomal protein S8 [Candidatus Daviesbacteria bacterium GW2011_GWB1_41_5]
MDTIGDLLIRIKNSYMARRGETEALYSKMALKICELLVNEGYIASCEKKDHKIKIVLKYDSSGSSMSRGEPAITGVKRISKPGRRVYKSKNLLPYVFEGMGVAIISTPKGIMTDKKARKEGVGGEVVAHVW